VAALEVGGGRRAALRVGRKRLEQPRQARLRLGVRARRVEERELPVADELDRQPRQVPAELGSVAPSPSSARDARRSDSCFSPSSFTKADASAHVGD
jgi:hypothetical protein